MLSIVSGETVSARRNIPAVDRVLEMLDAHSLPRPVVVRVVREHLASLRKSGEIPEVDGIVRRIIEKLDRLDRSRIQPVLNGTGVLVHTNLGRSPLGETAAQSLSEAAVSYTNLEFDLNHGKRGSRAEYLEHNLAILCGAEAATVVNNCAAALVLILRHFCGGEKNEVVISRGELIQIGGGFRIPDILESSGARLREVGTTNKTSIEDYELAIGDRTGLVLQVHRSNFFMEGFVASPPTKDLARLARKKKVPLIEDLGSGAMVDTDRLAPIEHEPTPAESLKQGVALVCFSGDKLFGGPQSGIIAGKKRLVRAVKQEPFFRALRCDKLVLSALQATVDAYLNGASDSDRAATIPLLEMLAAPCGPFRTRADTIVESLRGLPVEAGVKDSFARIGGGSLPRSRIPSIAVWLRPETETAAHLSSRLRLSHPPVIGYVEKGVLMLDLRTVLPGQDGSLIRALHAALEIRT